MSYVSENLDRLQHILPQQRVTLVAVSKYASVEQILEAFACGIRDFGENKIQDVQAKQAQIPAEINAQIRWHFLGHLQRNKAKKAIALNFALIQSVDSVVLAQQLSERAVAQAHPQAVLLQVNITQEPQKTGFSVETLSASFKAIQCLPGLAVKGLMTIGPTTHNPSALQMCFTQLRHQRNKLEIEYACRLPELSMGMSQDYPHAIECGATIIRVGNGIFTADPPEAMQVQ